MSQLRQFVARSRIPVSAQTLFDWHARPGAFERLSPPWDPPRLVERHGTIRDGDGVTLEVAVGPLPVRWTLRHKDFQDGVQFRDEQVSGPFHSWMHTHRMLPDGAGGAVLEDEIEYELPGGIVGGALGAALVRDKLVQLFAYRHAITAADLRRHARLSRSWQVAITGASGLLGSALTAFLCAGGHEVIRLVRRPTTPGRPTLGTEQLWDPIQKILAPSALEGLDLVINLSGENVAEGRWNDDRKRRIRNSRVPGTEFLATTLAHLHRPPPVFISASAIGIYRPQPPDVGIAESGESGDDFLGQVCRDWEAAAEPARAAGVRVVHPRMGAVLTPLGGALAKMLPAFRTGVAGKVGTGEQIVSWIALDDVLGALHHAARVAEVQGPLNLVAPAAVSNEQFTTTLGQALGRPTALPVPSAAINLLFGEMGRTLLLAGSRVAPQGLLDSGYSFEFPELGGALDHLLGRRKVVVRETRRRVEVDL